jgi:hypothetical protein
MTKASKAAKLVFTGSYVDGLRDAEGSLIDITKWVGLTLDDDQSDQLWESTTALEIVESCSNAIIDEEEHDADMPGQSDVFIEVRTHDVGALKQEILALIQKHLSDS